MAAKVPGELDEGCIFLMDVVQNPYRARFFPEKPDDMAPGPPQLTLQGFDPLHRRLEVLLEKLLEDFHDERDLTLGAQREMPDFHHKDRCKNRNAPGRIHFLQPGPPIFRAFFLRANFARPYFCVALIPPKVVGSGKSV